MIVGITLLDAGMLWLTRISAASGYCRRARPAGAVRRSATARVRPADRRPRWPASSPADAGAASGLVNVMQQVGGSLGLAVLVTVFGTASRNAAHHPLTGASPALQAHTALAHGMATAFLLAAVFDVVSLIVIIALIRTRAPISAPAPGRRGGRGGAGRLTRPARPRRQ